MILFKRTKVNNCDNCFLNKNDRCFLPAHPAQESMETIIRNCPCQECIIMMVCDNKCNKRHNYALTYVNKK
jgi:hypothetical protein